MTEEEIEKEIEKPENILRIIKAGTNVFKIGINIATTFFVGLLSKDDPNIGVYMLGSSSEPLIAICDQFSEYVNQRIMNSKRKKLFDSILSYEGFFSESVCEKINGMDFVVELQNTLSVIDRTARDEKVDYIVNLFCKYFIDEERHDVDPYEEYLQRLSTLSYREIEILVKLNQIEQEIAEAQQDAIEEGEEKSINIESESTKKLLSFANEKWNISKGEMLGILTGLCRSGFLREEVGAFLGYTGGTFGTTEYFDNFVKYIVPQQ